MVVGHSPQAFKKVLALNFGLSSCSATDMSRMIKTVRCSIALSLVGGSKPALSRCVQLELSASVYRFNTAAINS